MLARANPFAHPTNPILERNLPQCYADSKLTRTSASNWGISTNCFPPSSPRVWNLGVGMSRGLGVRVEEVVCSHKEVENAWLCVGVC